MNHGTESEPATTTETVGWPAVADSTCPAGFQDLPTGICLLQHGRLVCLNAAAIEVLGRPARVLRDLGSLDEVAIEQDREHVAAVLGGDCEEGTRHTLRFSVHCEDGSIRLLEFVFARTEFNGDGAVIGTLADVTEQDRLQRQLELAAAVFDSSYEGVIICDAQLGIQMVNPAFTAITGYSGDEAIGRTPGMLSSDRHGAAFYQEMWEMIELSGHWEGEIWNRRKNGDVFPEFLSITAMKDADGLVGHYIGVFTDVTHRKLSDRQLHRLVHYDTLTDLPNREMFKQQLKSRMVRARSNHAQLALIYIDVDNFKAINDSFGHAEGDSLLQVIAERLKNTLREGDRRRPPDIVARLGGDEFVVMIDDLHEVDHAGVVAQKILERIQRPVSLGGYTLPLDASLGIAVYPVDAENVDDLLHHADMAMYQAKRSGRGHYEFFTRQLRERVHRQMQLRGALHDALELGQFHLVFQPQIGAHNGMIRGIEALLRWEHPELGMVPPFEFIPLMEETGYIEAVGLWVIKEAARQCVAWKQRSAGPLRIAVNLSARQLRSASIVEDIKETLAATGLPPTCFEIELTESLAMEDVKITQRVLAQLSELGVRIAIDDFGTGYSSLSYLQHFFLDVLKIDRSFVGRCVDKHHDREIVRATIALAHSMGLEVVAEGVETAEQCAFLREQNVDLLQGYLFSKPVSAEEAGRLIECQNAFGGPPAELLRWMA